MAVLSANMTVGTDTFAMLVKTNAPLSVEQTSALIVPVQIAR
jgi:hypothetical protein